VNRRPPSKRLPTNHPAGGSHVRLLGEPQEIPSESLQLDSGDAVGLGMSAPTEARWVSGDPQMFDRTGFVLLSVDDSDRTLPTRTGEVGFPTISLTPAEARWLADGLIRRARAAEAGT
jgi:hypothetical protein